MSTQVSSVLSPSQQQLQKTLLTPWKMRLFYFQRLPSLFFWGVRVEELDANGCRIRLPFSWSTKNPFRSTYFSAQGGAAELSTGLLVLLASHGEPSISMLVIGMEMQFHKKVKGPMFWQCDEGQKVWGNMEKALTTGEGQVFQLKTVGRLEDGTIASEATITWSIKKRS
jgi:hypothetical protein